MLSLNVEKVLDSVSSLTSFLSWQLFRLCLIKSIRVHLTKGAIHTAAALKHTGVYIVIFSLIHTRGYKLQ